MKTVKLQIDQFNDVNLIVDSAIKEQGEFRFCMFLVISLKKIVDSSKSESGESTANTTRRRYREAFGYDKYKYYLTIWSFSSFLAVVSKMGVRILNVDGFYR